MELAPFQPHSDTSRTAAVAIQPRAGTRQVELVVAETGGAVTNLDFEAAL